MYKVVIIDDEPIIVEGLKRVIPWEKYNCKVVATVHDGLDGANVIREHSPHIVFTDIRMSTMDGLTMLAGLKSEFPDMQVTVLTGFRDFSYAQEAINLGVCKYLLKPSKMDELQAALSAMTKNLERLGANFNKELSESNGDSANSFIVRQAIDYIEEHCTEKISLLEVATVCYVSQWHLSKLLKKYADQNFYDILNGARIKKAKKLLKDPSLRISEISELIGYSDTAHFSRTFRKNVGMSANEYRNAKLFN